MAFNFYTSSCSDDIRVTCLLDSLILTRFSHVSNIYFSYIWRFSIVSIENYFEFCDDLVYWEWLIFFWRFSHCNKFGFIHHLFFIYFFWFIFFLNHHSCEAKNTMTIMSLACLAERTLSRDRQFLLSLSTQMFASASKHHLFRADLISYGLVIKQFTCIRYILSKLRGRIDKIQML